MFVYACVRVSGVGESVCSNSHICVCVCSSVCALGPQGWDPINLLRTEVTGLEIRPDCIAAGHPMGAGVREEVEQRSD